MRFQINKKMDDPDYLGGSPWLSPFYFFGLDALPPSAPSPASSDSNTLRTIGRVRASNHLYEVSLVGQEDVDGRLCSQLLLRPLRDAGRNRIRGLWVDLQSGLPLKILSEGDFNNSSTAKARWTSEYHLVNGTPLLYRISTTDELRFPFPRKRSYDEAVVSFEELSFDGKPKSIRLMGTRANAILAQPDGS